jgi:UPF0042 nucleotide-binding protein
VAINLISFGYKYGAPAVPHVFDCRGLPNPHSRLEFRYKNGLDHEVRLMVVEHPKAFALAQQVLQYVREQYTSAMPGRSVTLYFGCVGGRHRSVAMVEYLKPILRGFGTVSVTHRDIAKKGGE